MGTFSYKIRTVLIIEGKGHTKTTRNKVTNKKLHQLHLFATEQHKHLGFFLRPPEGNSLKFIVRERSYLENDNRVPIISNLT